jgi:hypothetical protein
MKLIQAAARKNGYPLSIAYYDIAFGTVFSIPVLKLLLFDHNANIGIFDSSFLGASGYKLHAERQFVDLIIPFDFPVWSK